MRCRISILCAGGEHICDYREAGMFSSSVGSPSLAVAMESRKVQLQATSEPRYVVFKVLLKWSVCGLLAFDFDQFLVWIQNRDTPSFT